MSLDFTSLSDGELAALTLAGRQAAFAEIMSRHRAAVYRLVRGHVGDPDEALDLVQESFTAAFRALDRYDASRPMRAWLSRIAINKCRDWSRRRAVRRLISSVSLTGTTILDVADSSPRIDDAAADREELELLWRAIAELPRALKEPLLLRVVDGLSQAEVADVLGISEKAVETRVYRARTRLAKARTDMAPSSPG